MQRFAVVLGILACGFEGVEDLASDFLDALGPFVGLVGPARSIEE